MSEPTDVAARIATLETQLAAIQHELAALKHDVHTPPLASRRDVFKKLAVAGAGAAVGAVTLARPAAAADGQAIAAGQTTTAETTTTVHYDSASPTNAILRAVDDPADAASTVYAAALDGGASGRVVNGVLGTTTRPEGYGVVGWSNGGTGMLARGTRANLRLATEGDAPYDRRDDHEVGEVLCDDQGDVWLCIASGNPGIWQLIGGPNSADVHFLPNTRVHDSRDEGEQGRLVGGSEAQVFTARYPGSFGQNFILVPGPATVIVNLTITDTLGSGYLALYSTAEKNERLQSDINWYTDGQIMAITTYAYVAEDGILRVLARGPGSTHFVVNVIGYHGRPIIYE